MFYLTLSVCCSLPAALQLLSRPQTDGRALERNPTLKISRATRVTEKWNASLDREITNANELRHLDEFLGNQVGRSNALVTLSQHAYLTC